MIEYVQCIRSRNTTSEWTRFEKVDFLSTSFKSSCCRHDEYSGDVTSAIGRLTSARYPSIQHFLRWVFEIIRLMYVVQVRALAVVAGDAVEDSRITSASSRVLELEYSLIGVAQSVMRKSVLG